MPHVSYGRLCVSCRTASECTKLPGVEFVCDLDFGIGTTLAFFHRLGIMLLVIDALKMWQIGSEISNAKSRRNQFWMPSGPGDLWTLICDILLNTSNGSMMDSFAASLISTEQSGSNGDRSFDTYCSELFIRSVSNWASPSATLFISD